MNLNETRTMRAHTANSPPSTGSQNHGLVFLNADHGSALQIHRDRRREYATCATGSVTSTRATWTGAAGTSAASRRIQGDG